MASPMSLDRILNPMETTCSSPLSSAPSSPASELTVFSQSPSPPPSLEMVYRSRGQCPTPPASQISGSGTPRPYDESTCSSSTEREERPAKRRRTEERMAAGTTYLDLGRLPYDTSSEQQPQLNRLLEGLRKKKRIVVVAGAGISVSAGIPDFRSATGIFKTIKEEYNLKGSGKDLFDASVYRDSNTTSTFHHMVRQMSEMTKNAKPTPFHDLVARLAHEGRLLRLYTQNIDGLDTSLEPLKTQIPLPKKGPWPKCIQLHGGLAKMQCSKCGQLADFDPTKFDGPQAPPCDVCAALDKTRTEIAGKRSHGVGCMRPRMVLYSESSPDEDAIGAVSISDLRARPDAIIVVGTSMKIPGVRRIVKEMCALVRDKRAGLAVWINNDPEPAGKDFSWDIVVKGTSDEVAELAGLGKWDDPVFEVEPASADQMEARPSNQPSVVISTPSKKSRLPTPQDSPAPAKLDLETMPERAETTSNPASKGPSIHAMLNIANAKPAAAPKPRSKTRKPTTKASANKSTGSSAKLNLKLNFKVNKGHTENLGVKESKAGVLTAKKEPMTELRAGSPKTNTSGPQEIVPADVAADKLWTTTSA